MSTSATEALDAHYGRAKIGIRDGLSDSLSVSWIALIEIRVLVDTLADRLGPDRARNLICCCTNIALLRREGSVAPYELWKEVINCE
jgi:hypothetical protein